MFIVTRPMAGSNALQASKRCAAFDILADFVEKLRFSDVVIFRKEPVIPKSQMRFAMRRRELSHKRQKTNFAEPLVSKSWLRRADKNFTDFAKNRVFQQYQPNSTDAARRTNVCIAPCDQFRACASISAVFPLPVGQKHLRPWGSRP